MATKDEIDDLIFGPLIFETPNKEKPKPVRKYCVKVVGNDELGKLNSKLHCEQFEIDKPKGVSI